MTVYTCKLMSMPIEQVPLPLLQADLDYHVRDVQQCRAIARGLHAEEAEYYLASASHGQRIIHIIEQEMERRSGEEE